MREKKVEVEPKRKLYCSYCGNQLIREMIGAEVVRGYGNHQMYSKFDTGTGKRQYVFRYRCPFNKLGVWIFDRHDCYEADEFIAIQPPIKERTK